MRFTASAGVALFLAACFAPSPSATGETARVIVEGVKLLQQQTYPVRITLVVSGRKAKDAPVDVAQERKGNEIFLTLSQAVAAGQSAAHEAFELRVGLEGGFTSGRYTLRVNDHSTEFEV